MYKVCYWDADAKAQFERDATPDEIAEIEANRATAPAQEAERVRLAEIDTDIVSDSQSATLKAMSRAEFSAWFDARTTAQKMELLKRIAFIVIRRVL